MLKYGTFNCKVLREFYLLFSTGSLWQCFACFIVYIHTNTIGHYSSQAFFSVICSNLFILLVSPETNLFQDHQTIDYNWSQNPNLIDRCKTTLSLKSVWF